MEDAAASNSGKFQLYKTATVILSLVFMAVASIGSISRESLTYDEGSHISAGLAFWQKHDARVSPDHPPLLRMISAIPLVVKGVHPDYSSPVFCGAAPCEWWFGTQFVERLGRDELWQIALLARLPMLILSLILGLVLYWQARMLWSETAALVVLTVFCTSPFFIGYGTLVITDVGLVLFVLLSGWALASLLDAPSFRNAFWFAATTAAAFLSKFSAVLLVPSMLLAFIWWYWRHRKQNLHFTRALYWLLLGCALSCVFMYAFYIVFARGTWPPALLADQIHSMPPGLKIRYLAVQQFDFMQRHPALIRPLQPLWLYLIGPWRLLAWFSHTGFLLGSWRNGGTWYYFPLLALLKSSPGLLLLWLMIPLLLAQRNLSLSKQELVAPKFQTHAVVLVCLLVVFAGSAMLSDVNIGIRHFSVPIVLLTLAVGLVPTALGQLRSNPAIQRGLLIVPLVICLCTALFSYPHYVSYFNLFIGGVPKQEIAIDSNLDWGQSLIELEEFRASNNIPAIWVNAFSLLNPGTYVTGAHPWVCGKGIPRGAEWLAVSANWMTSAPPSCAYLFRYDHIAISDGTMYVIHVR